MPSFARRGMPATELQMIDAVDVAAEDRALGRCDCGSDWKRLSETVMPLAGGRWADIIAVVCEGCMSTRAATFEISAFFSPDPKVWARWPN